MDDDYLKLAEEQIEPNGIFKLVSHTECGAVAAFFGTTRCSVQTKVVSCLEYEAYVPMAMRNLREIIAEARVKWPTIRRVAIIHRFGMVCVGEISIGVGVSSPHRDAAQCAVQWIVSEIKAKVPIWKKEIYTDGSGCWRANPECVIEMKN